MEATAQTTAFEPCEVAGWIGLPDATLLGTQPIELEPATAEKLRAHGARAELTTHEAAAVLRVNHTQVRNYILAERRVKRTVSGRVEVRTEARAVVLGHRRTPGGRVLIPAGDLATFVASASAPPVRTTGSLGMVDMVAARAAEDQVRKRHNLQKTRRELFTKPHPRHITRSATVPRRPKSRPASGSESEYMAELLDRPTVLKLLLLWGTYGDGCGQDAIARRMKTVGVQLNGDQVVELYHLAVANAKQPMGSQKRKKKAA